MNPPRLHVVADLGYIGSLSAWLRLLAELDAVAVSHRFAVQVRARGLTGAEFVAAARNARQAAKEVLLVLNGDHELATALGFDGVHWPEAAIPAAPVADPLAIRSAAVHTLAAVRRAEAAGATAAIFSPVFASRWKQTHGGGLPALQAAAAATKLPVYALGGVTPERCAACIQAGAAGVAALSPIADAADRGVAVGQYMAALRTAYAEQRMASRTTGALGRSSLAAKLTPGPQESATPKFPALPCWPSRQ